MKSKPDFVYITYIRTTPEKLWQAITNPEFTRQYWGGYENISDWQKGSEWKHRDSNDKNVCRIAGKVLESNPPKRLVISWAAPDNSTDVSRVTFEIEATGPIVRLSVIHGDFTADSQMADKVSSGWPLVLSSLKSFLEDGQAIDILQLKTCKG